MFEQLGHWQHRAEAITVFLVCLAIAFYAVPNFTDNKNLPKLYNFDTKQAIYQKMMSEQFVFAVVASGVIAILFFGARIEEKPIVRRRSIVEVWMDIPRFELSKFGLKSALDKRFMQDGLYNFDKTYSIFRSPMIYEGKYRYICFDMLEDWARRATTPIFTFDASNMGIERAKSILAPKAEPFGKFLETMEKYGVSQEEMRRKLAQAQLESEREKRNQPIEGQEGGTS